ncbi:flagellar protein FliT [Actimicrobium antarcticum]|uniref:Flagellar protein FliT n=1 Tax=Actimicrobium antarcticum TaxID=1051899 RepID=A0ABP7SQX1_9BURK
MNSQEVLDVYETVAVITDQMLAAARKRDWEELVVLESRVAGHVSSLKSGEQPAALTGETRLRKVQIIQKILAHDRLIRDITEPWMAELAILMNSAGTERKLSQAYGS